MNEKAISIVCAFVCVVCWGVAYANYGPASSVISDWTINFIYAQLLGIVCLFGMAGTGSFGDFKVLLTAPRAVHISLWQYVLGSVFAFIPFVIGLKLASQNNIAGIFIALTSLYPAVTFGTGFAFGQTTFILWMALVGVVGGVISMVFLALATA